METKAPENVDHILYAVPDLADGMDQVEHLLGVRPAPGGRHPSYGTHNAVLSLGQATYLEVIARDPDLPRPDDGVLFGMDRLVEPRLVAWVLRSEDIENVAARVRSAGVNLGDIQSGYRERPDGSVVSWRLTDPRAMLLGGCVPFLISWGATTHPASVAPRGGELVGLRAEHPEPEPVRVALHALGVELPVGISDTARLVATVRTDRGDVELG